MQVMSNGNWMHILYQSKLDAKKVLYFVVYNEVGLSCAKGPTSCFYCGGFPMLYTYVVYTVFCFTNFHNSLKKYFITQKIFFSNWVNIFLVGCLFNLHSTCCIDAAQLAHCHLHQFTLNY